MGELCCLDKTGDTKIIWNPNNTDEVANAKRTFDDLRKKGYVAFSVEKNGDKGTEISTFDPNAEKLILCPPLRGG